MKADPELAVDELVNQDRTAREVSPFSAFGDLEHEVVEEHGVVVADDALVLRRDEELEIDAADRGEGALWLTGPNGEPSIEVSLEGAFEKDVGIRVVVNGREAKLLGQAALDRLEGPLAASPSFR